MLKKAPFTYVNGASILYIQQLLHYISLAALQLIVAEEEAILLLLNQMELMTLVYLAQAVLIH